jgi:anti-anti-sigma regulatory factor
VTCKIRREAVGEDRVVVRVSGRITGDAVATLRTVLEQEKSDALALDLKDVQLVDCEAIKLLAGYETNGTKIDNCPLYIREWIRLERQGN